MEKSFLFLIIRSNKSLLRQAYSASRFMFRLKNGQQSMKVNRTKLMKEEKIICLYRDIKKESLYCQFIRASWRK
uniref:hypothetical protein n=1 Tax=Prochlorococcus marinus TaxID=1219 RepID=UPI0005A1F2AA|nr:hypothetical protein [Prochlorococcus marinus]